MAQLKKLAKQTVLYGVSSILARVLTFLFITPYLTYNFTKYDLGVQTDIYVWGAFLIIPFTYRMETALFNFGKKAEDRAKAFRTISLSIFFTTALFVLILLLFSGDIARLLEYPQLRYLVVWMVLILGLDALAAIPFALLRLEGRAMLFAVLKVLHMLLYLGGMLFFLELGPVLQKGGWAAANIWYQPAIGIGYVFLANLIASATICLLLLPTYFKIRRTTQQDPFFDWRLWKKIMRYAAPLIVAGLAGVINEVLDRTLLKALLPGTVKERLAMVGVYGACYKISIFMNLFTQAFNYAAEPFFFKNADKAHAKQLYANIAFVFTLVACFGFLGIMLFMDIVQYFVSAPFREGLVIVPILLIANLFLGLYYNVAAWYKLAENKTIFGAYISTIGATITVVANLILIPYLGYVGSAWATLACYVSMVVICYLLGQKYYPIPYPVFKILTYIILAVGIYLLFAMLKPWITAPFLSYLLSLFMLMLFAGLLYLMDGKKIRKIIKQ